VSLGIWIFFISWSCLASAKEVILSPGDTKSLPATGRAWVEKSKVIQLSDQGRSFIIRGIRPGSSLLKIGKESYHVSVLSPDQERAYQRLKPAVEKSLNLEISAQDGQIQVRGHLIRWSDWEKLYRACQSQTCDYLMTVTMSESLRKVARQKISDLFEQNGLPPQNLMFDRHIQTLVSDKGEVAGRVRHLLSALGIRAIATASNLDLEPLVKVQITVAEVRKSESLKYGIEWPETYSAQVLPNSVGSGFEKALTLKFLENQGLAKVLASPTIICRSGKEAHFFAGGEFPIKILNYKVQDVVWKKYGILLNVKPKADFSGKMSISIETEVSSINADKSIDGLPALFTNKIQSHFDLNESRLIALSGLIKNEQSENSQGLPGLSRLPVLGALFSSKAFQDDRTELVVFVKPEVISPGSLEARQ
jgi:pilus assembly protein CpaC